MLNIREAEINDLNSISNLSKYLGYRSASEDVTGKRLGKLLKSDSNKVWVYEKDGQVLGWIHVFLANRLASASFVEIGGMVVDPDFRRRNIGRDLVEHAKEWADSINLHLRVRCNKKRTETHQFYESIGFSLSKKQHVYELTV